MLIKLDGENIIGHDYEVSCPDPENYTQISEAKLVNEKGEYKYKYVDGELVELSAAEIKAHPVRQANKMQGIKTIRNKLLAECDYIFLSDGKAKTASKSNFKIYREALRNLPDNVADVDNVDWPEKPEYVTD